MTDNNLITISAYDEFRGQMDEVKDVCNFIPDTTTNEGYAKSKRVSLDVDKLRIAIEKERVKQKAEFIAKGRAVDSEAKTIIEEIEKFQLPHKQAYKELDQLKKEREQERKDKLEVRVSLMRETPAMMVDSSSDEVKQALEDIKGNECLDFYEYSEKALKARNQAVEELSAMFAAKLNQEKDAAELEELRKKQAIQAQKDHDEQIAKEASAKAEAEAAEAKAAEKAAIDAAAEAVRQREAAEAKAIADAAQAKENTEIAEKKADEDRAAAVERAKQQQIKHQKDEEVKQAKIQEQREADMKHVGSIRKAAKESFMVLGIDEAKAKELVLAIHNKKIENVFISY